MKITALGLNAHNAWFARRLARQGFVVDTEISLPAALRKPLAQAEWTGLLVDNILVDTGSTGLVQRHQLAAQCPQHGWAYAELAGHWLSLGVEHGFPLFVGTHANTRDQLQPVLNALAPQAGIWLYCGPAGGGCYASRIFDAISVIYVLALKAGWPAPGETPRPLDWNAFFSQQQDLANRLLQLSELYLSFHPEMTELDVGQQLAAFSLPPALQTHFSANLARLIVLSLGQRQALQQIFDQLMQGPPPAALGV